MHPGLQTWEIIGYYPQFPVAIPVPRVRHQSFLPRLPLSPLRVLARLACLIHAANVHSEPGSNPSCNLLERQPKLPLAINRKFVQCASSLVMHLALFWLTLIGATNQIFKEQRRVRYLRRSRREGDDTHVKRSVNQPAAIFPWPLGPPSSRGRKCFAAQIFP